MKKYFSILLFLIATAPLRSQNRTQAYSSSSGYTFCDWDKVSLKPEYVPIAGDTAMVFVSTRNYFPNNEFFLSYDFDATNTLHCFTIYFNQNKWICVPRKDLEHAVNQAPKGGSAVVFVEGFGKTFIGGVDRATRLARTYNVLTIYFDWPTRDPNFKQGKNYRATRKVSKLAAKPFTDFMVQMNQLKKVGKVNYAHLTLFMHSMGNLLMKYSVEKNYLDPKDTLFDNIILNAACVNHRHHKNWLEKMEVKDQIYVMQNKNDKILKGAKLISFRRQLGQFPKGAFAKNALYINYSARLDEEHNYFLFTYVLKRNPDIKKVYVSIFEGIKPVFDDEKKYKKIPTKNRIDFINTNPPKSKDIGLGISTF